MPEALYLAFQCACARWVAKRYSTWRRRPGMASGATEDHRGRPGSAAWLARRGGRGVAALRRGWGGVDRTRRGERRGPPGIGRRRPASLGMAGITARYGRASHEAGPHGPLWRMRTIAVGRWETGPFHSPDPGLRPRRVAAGFSPGRRQALASIKGRGAIAASCGFRFPCASRREKHLSPPPRAARFSKQSAKAPRESVKPVYWQKPTGGY